MVQDIFLIHRRKIDEIDNKIMNLVEQRLNNARKIGEYKKKNKISIIDKKREKEILQSRIKNSKLSKDFTKKLFLTIILESRKVQK